MIFIRRQNMIKRLIEQELTSRPWHELVPDLPIDCSQLEALRYAQSALEKEYELIEDEDLVTLFRIFIEETDNYVETPKAA